MIHQLDGDGGGLRACAAKRQETGAIKDDDLEIDAFARRDEN